MARWQERRWTRRPSPAGAESPASAWPWVDRHFPSKFRASPDNRTGVVSARGSHISLPEVPGASASEAPGLPTLSVAPPSFDAVYRAHAKTVSRWASRLLGPGGDCEDVVQEVFIVVRHKLPRFEGPAEITTWLYEITVRVVPGLATAPPLVVVGDRARAQPQPRPPSRPPFAAGRGRA
jgi:hypothetical protein